MLLDSLKEHRKHNLKITQGEIALESGISLPRISAFECGNRIPAEHHRVLATAYRCAKNVLLALNRGEEIEIENYPVSGRDFWAFADKAPVGGGDVNGQGERRSGDRRDAAANGGGMPGPATVDGIGPGNDSGASGELRGTASVARERGFQRPLAAAQTLAAIGSGAEA